MGDYVIFRRAIVGYRTSDIAPSLAANALIEAGTIGADDVIPCDGRELPVDADELRAELRGAWGNHVPDLRRPVNAIHYSS